MTLRYQMCPECFVVFFPTSMTGETFVLGCHKEECSQPKLETFEEEPDVVIERLKKKQAFDKKVKKNW